MKRLILSLAFSALALCAQDNVLSNEARAAWNRTKGNILGAAEKMPADAYSFKPTPESMSFQDLVTHTADAGMESCSMFNGEAKKLGAAQKTTKAEIVEALKAAMAECDTAYGALTDAKASEMFESRRGPMSRMGALYQNTIHLEHEYAQMAVHIRLKGLVPPSSERRPGMGKKK